MSEPAPVVIPIKADTTQLEKDIGDAAEKAGGAGGKKAGAKFVRNLGVGLAVGGAGLEKFARTAQDATLQLTRVAQSTGLPRDALRNLAADTSNAGFQVQEVLDTFEELGKQGVSTSKDLQRVANVWDTVADATGGNAAELAKSSNALAAFGINAKNPEKALNALGTVAFHTRDGIAGFTGFLEKNGPKLAGYGLSVDDIAAAMVALNSKGLTGRKAQTAFSTAIQKSNGNIKKALATLGVGSKDYDKFRKSVKNGSGELQKSAKAADDVLTPMQKLHAWFQALILKGGTFGKIAGNVAPVLVGLGTALGTAGSAARFFDTTIGKKLVSSLKTFITALKISNIQATFLAVKAKIIAVATRAWALAQQFLNFVMNQNPLVRIVTIIIALGVALVIAYKKSATFRHIVQTVFHAVAAAGKFMWNNVLKPTFEALKTAWHAIGTAFSTVGHAIAAVFGFIKKHWGLLLIPLTAGFSFLIQHWRGVRTVFATVWHFIRDNVFNPLKRAFQVVANFIGRVADGMRATLRPLIAAFRWVENVVMGIINGIKGGIQDIKDALNSLNPFKSINGKGIIKQFLKDHPGPGGSSGSPQRRATGGRATRGVPYVVGENREELFVPDQNGRVVPRVPAEWKSLLDIVNRGSGGTSGAMLHQTTMEGSKAIEINQNYFGPTTSAGRRRELEWTMKYATV